MSCNQYDDASHVSNLVSGLIRASERNLVEEPRHCCRWNADSKLKPMKSIDKARTLQLWDYGVSERSLSILLFPWKLNQQRQKVKLWAHPICQGKRWWCCQDGKRSQWVRRKGIGLNQCLPPSKEPHGVPSKERQTKHFGLARANTSIFLQHVLLSEIFCLHYLATLPDSH